MFRFATAVIVSMTASFVFAQAEVEDRFVGEINHNAGTDATAVQSGNNLAEMYYQMQMLQQEVLQLRGMVEEQAYQIKRLKQQRLDDYVDLDRRIGSISQSGAGLGVTSPESLPKGNAPQNGQLSTATQSVETAGVSQPQGDEFEEYKKAYRIATRDPAAAETALKQYLQDFPNSRFVANSLFVLGEIKLKMGELEDARAWFMRVINEHPNHYRVANAKLKLGLVFQQSNNMAQAKKYWQEVASGNSTAAEKAKEYLATYFSN